MPDRQKKFHSTNGKRQILVVDDEAINRELLGLMLQDIYEILFAGDGREALELIRLHKETLSLVLLDILMPVMSGLEVLKEVRADVSLAQIPVIVLTADQKAEVECLNLGAADFIPKPYPDPAVVQARVFRTIELSEDRDIIRSTERDTLTGLYNKEYFYRYAEHYDQHHRNQSMDAVIVDVNHFHMINERYGKPYGDEVLRRISAKLREFVHKSDGIVCRRQADTFMIYCPHREDYKEILENASVGLSGEESADNRVRLRMGIYSNADKSVDIERRFDRAKVAADTVQGSFSRTIAYYDEAIHEKELFSEQLIEDFYTAIREKQFSVFYQPKFDVRPDEPALSSAEALVRWNHPKLGMISPGVFIPLFEDNGLIQELDNFVWREVCRQIREWKDRFGITIPVSVNVSRIDLYDPHLIQTFRDLIKEFSLSCKDLMLEITESAYTQDSGQISEVAERLRAIGFSIEMDDFGTGYSSLNMVSSLPFDVLKLDMQFIRNAFQEGGDTRMLELIIDIADYLDVPVIAEGVETEEQMQALKTMGCDLVQGFYFSKPVPPGEFEKFIQEKKEYESAEIAAEKLISDETADAVSKEAGVSKESGAAENTAENQAAETISGPDSTGHIYSEIDPPQNAASAAAGASHEASAGLSPGDSAGDASETSGGDSPVSLSDAASGRTAAPGSHPEYYLEPASASSGKRSRGGLHMRTATIFFVIIAVIAAIALFTADISVARGYQRMERASDRYVAAQLAATEMEAASDYLTDRVRCFVVTGETEYLDDFFTEVEISKRRDQAVADLEQLLEGNDDGALSSLNTALQLSNELIETEKHAMRLKLETVSHDLQEIPDAIRAVELSPEDLALSPDEMNHKAQSLVFDNNYMHYKDKIRENVGQCTQALIRTSSQELENASSRMALLVSIQTAMTVVFLAIVLIIVFFINQLIRRPLTHMVDLMRTQEVIPPTGAEELQFVTRTYNTILRENKLARDKLSHEASHDALTGLLNRGAYDMLMQSVDTSHIALIILDVDYFKSVNDNYGHAVGDRVLKRVAEILRHSFRSVDILCRIGGDEFVVIMTRVNSSMRQLVLNKIARANDLLQHPKDDLPPVSLSVGVAFSDRENPQGDIFKDADTALYRVKDAGRNGCEIY